MKPYVLSFLVLMLLTVSCQHPVGSASGRHDAESLMAKIRPGMTVAQIQQTVPHLSFTREPIFEHGGVWYDITISDDYIIQFRAAHPKSGQVDDQSIINYSPRLRDKRTLAFISGEERPW